MAAAGVSFILALVAVVFVQHATAQATSHTVGDSTGWSSTAGAGFYSEWAAKNSFSVGDSLVFNFQTGAHDVLEVTEASFNTCSFNTTDDDIKRQGPVTEVLDEAGMHYFVCTIGQHCLGGSQKLSVNVSATARVPGGPPMMPPSSLSPPSPPPPSPSSSNAVMASLYVTLSAIVMSLF